MKALIFENIVLHETVYLLKILTGLYSSYQKLEVIEQPVYEKLFY